jgi:CxxC-x17-CxxC domain-containing protein
MERRDRDNRKFSGRNNNPAPAGRGPNPGYRRAAPAEPRLASYEDPNAYRSPGFQDVTHNPYKLDYAGLPKDDDETQPGFGNERTPANAVPRGMNGRRPDRTGTDPNAYRSPSFHSNHNKGTQSKGFALKPAVVEEAVSEDAAGESQTDALAGKARRPQEPRREGAPRRERRERPRFETTCTACNAPAVVPFEPGPTRPAFCKPCYEAKKGELGLGPGKRIVSPPEVPPTA